MLFRSARMEDHGVGDARAEDDIMGLPRWRGPHGDARMSVLKNGRAFGLRTVARGAAVLRRLGGNGWRGLQMT